MCMYIFLCVHTHAWIHVCTCVHMHAETKGCWISPLILLYLNFLRQDLSIALELKGSTRLSGHQVPGTPFMWVLESKLGSSWLYGKHFADWDFSSVQIFLNDNSIISFNPPRQSLSLGLAPMYRWRNWYEKIKDTCPSHRVGKWKHTFKLEQENSRDPSLSLEELWVLVHSF